MANFFSKPYFDKPFFNSPFFKGAYFHLPFFTGIGGGTTTPTPTPATVKSSKIYANNDKRIMVEFDQEMQGVGDLRQKIFIKIDGGAPVIPSSLSFNGDFMSLVFATGFTAGQSVTWSYDDSDPTIKLETKHHVLMDNQTYAVTNDLAANPPPPADDVPDTDVGDIKPKKKRAKTK